MKIFKLAVIACFLAVLAVPPASAENNCDATQEFDLTSGDSGDTGATGDGGDGGASGDAGDGGDGGDSGSARGGSGDGGVRTRP